MIILGNYRAARSAAILGSGAFVGGETLPVLAVTGLKREARLAAGPGVATIGAGGNPVRLRALLGARIKPGCRAVVSIGIAGGLDPELMPGDVVIGTGVVGARQRWEAHADMARLLAERLEGHTKRVVQADLAGVDAPALSLVEKSTLRAATGAAAVDMESHVAAAFAESHGLPFTAVRVVCDPADRALPAFVARALRPDGEVDLAAVLLAIARRSAKVGGLVRLARDARTAFEALRHCRSLLGFGLSVPHFDELLSDVS